MEYGVNCCDEILNAIDVEFRGRGEDIENLYKSILEKKNVKVKNIALIIKAKCPRCQRVYNFHFIIVE